MHGEFLRGLRDLGYLEGKNLALEWRFAGGKTDPLFALATEILQAKVDVIVAGGSPATSAAQKATSSIPIVMINAGDPVGSGFVKSLARPGGNITGVSSLWGETSTKHLEILLEIMPALSRVAMLINPANSLHPVILEKVARAAQARNVRIFPAIARTVQEIESAFSLMTREKVEALIVAPDPSFNQEARQIAERALKLRLLSIAGLREQMDNGGLLSYGASSADGFRRSATYVDKILKGAKPGDLPVEQPTIFELGVNMKTALALSVKMPTAILLQATKVVE